MLTNGLHYEQHGQGIPILCIHGAGSSAQMWAEPAARLAHLGRVVTYDRRGYGRSARGGEGVCVARHADDAAALLTALNATPAIVIGRSYGGEVATDLALRHPALVRALVLLEGAPAALWPAAETWTRGVRDRLEAVAARAGLDAVGEALIGEVLGEGGWDSLPPEARDIFTANGPGALADLRGAWLLVDPAALAAIRCPVLLVGAAESRPEFRDPNEAMAAALSDARIVLVGGGHLIDPAGREVLAFIGEQVAAVVR